jgi:hypothetical protein
MSSDVLDDPEELLDDEAHELQEELDETSAEFVDQLVKKLLLFTEEFCDVKFFPYQIPIAYRVIESVILGDGELLTVIATRQSGKALSLDTPIPTPFGWKSFGELVPGDQVFGPEGIPVRVLARTPVWEDRPCYRVTFNDGTSIVADEQHLWQMSDDTVITTKSLISRSKSRSGHGIDLMRPAQIDAPMLRVDPYVLGAWLGDGGSRDGRFTSADPEILERIAKYYRVERKDSYGPYGHYIYGLSPDLIALGVMDRYGTTQGQRKHIPMSYLRASYEDRVALLQGLMDTDGYITEDGRCEFCVTRKELAQDVVELLRSLGIKARITESDAVLNGRAVGTRYRIHFSAFSNHGPVPFHLTRKQERLRPHPTGVARSQKQFVVSVEPVASVPVRCIQVEGGLFAAGEGWTITHNSEVLSNVLAAMMVILPKLAPIYPVWLEKFSKGFWVGIFAPTEDQADTVFGRIVSKLTSDHAMDFLLDPEIDDKATSGGVRGKGKIVTLKNSGSLCRMQSCNPKAKIESKTYHFAMIDEAQEADEFMITKSIQPMLAFNNGTICLTGTATRNKCYFYKMIQYNKRRSTTARRGFRECHFEYDYKVASKYNPNYAKFIAKEKVRIGEDSDEYRMSYKNEWILEKGMFVTEDKLDRLYDPSMPLVKQWWRTPIVMGIDVARTNDSTVATAVWVDWDHPDGFGFFEHRVLDWLEINDTEWEKQYFEILDFVRQYNVLRIGVDSQGVGGAVAERLQVLLPDIEVLAMGSDAKAQNERWVHLMELIQREQLIIPGHSKARRTRAWKKFNQQMVDLERIYRGPYLLAEAPHEKGAFDDFPDSLALACAMTVYDTLPQVEVAVNPFYR